MKNIIITTCLLWMAEFSLAQIYQPFENASRQELTDSCFGHPGSSHSTSNAINGKSFRTGQLTSLTMNHGVIFPYMYLDGDDTLIFKHRASSNTGYYYLTVYTLDVNGNIIDTLLCHSYNKSTAIFTACIQVVDSGVRKIQFAFNGQGGTGRGVLDDVFISADWVVDLHTCQVNPNATPLPVSLLSMKAEALEQGNLISWSTALEENNMGFELYRASLDGAFERIAWIEGNGNTHSIHTYNYLDLTSTPEARYYLKQIDYNGKSEIFPVIYVQNSHLDQHNISLFPNPANGHVFLRQDESTGSNKVNVSDFSGRILKEITLTGSQLERIELDGLLPGWYTVTVYSEQAIIYQSKLSIR